MKRAALLYCADVDAPRYKLLKQRDQLPFVADTELEEASDKWTNFKLDDAFRLRLHLDLIGNDGSKEYPHPGVAPSYAVSIIYNGLFNIIESPLTSAAADLWVGVMIVEAPEEGEDGKPLRFSRWFGGPLGELTKWISEVSEQEGSAPVRVLMANASRAARFVRQRAEELGLPEAAQLKQA